MKIFVYMILALLSIVYFYLLFRAVAKGVCRSFVEELIRWQIYQRLEQEETDGKAEHEGTTQGVVREEG